MCLHIRTIVLLPVASFRGVMCTCCTAVLRVHQTLPPFQRENRHSWKSYRLLQYHSLKFWYQEKKSQENNSQAARYNTNKLGFNMAEFGCNMEHTQTQIQRPVKWDWHMKLNSKVCSKQMKACVEVLVQHWINSVDEWRRPTFQSPLLKHVVVSQELQSCLIQSLNCGKCFL